MVLWINIFIWQIFAHQHFEVEKQLNKLFCIWAEITHVLYLPA